MNTSANGDIPNDSLDMPTPKSLTLDQCAVHTVTVKPMGLRSCCERLAALGFGGVCLWREAVADVGIDEAKRIIEASGLSVPALVRGGFFVSESAGKRANAIDENRRCLDEAAALGASMVVIVPGADPAVSLPRARGQVADGLEAVADYARSVGVKLALEPLHPMYAGDRSCVNTLAQGRAICEQLAGAPVGIAVDVYHVWWDPELNIELDRLGSQGLIAAFHACDWFPDTRNRLTDRALMGDGVIDIRGIRARAEAAGFNGPVEIEVIGDRYWEGNQAEYLDTIAERCLSAT